MSEDKTFDPVLLRTYLAVVNGLSFTRAAERLGISQPAVSQHVRRLEQAAGRLLLRRDTRTVALTDNGEAMAGFARTILAAHDEAVSLHLLIEARILNGELRGRREAQLRVRLVEAATQTIGASERDQHVRPGGGHLDRTSEDFERGLRAAGIEIGAAEREVHVRHHRP